MTRLLRSKYCPMINREGDLWRLNRSGKPPGAATGLEHTSYLCKLLKATPGLRRERRHWLVGAWLSWQDGKWVLEHALSLQETLGRLGDSCQEDSWRSLRIDQRRNLPNGPA